MSTISRHLQYMNTLNFKNILALLDIHAFIPSVKLYQCRKEIFFKNTTEIEIPRSVNGDGFSYNAP
jgi:hypothetical protein